MPQSLAAVYVQLVFSTKNRHPFLVDYALRRQVFANLNAISIELGCPAVEVGGVSDHVHVLVRLGRSLSIADCVKELKRASSLQAKRLSPTLREFSWQSGYGGFSVSQDGVPATRRYLQTQEEHHKTETFQEEFLRLLREHDLEWDEKYIWD